ncbi:MAG: response regulator [Deltaproteobacteria bacterium]|nr:response regulator [Deltaproteobacteria bacterium]
MTLPSSILVIDDDDVFRHRLARAFKDREIEAFEAGERAEALSQLEKFKPEAVVLDLKLGLESGLELLVQLKRIHSDIKVVVLTGYGTIATAVEALKRGAVNYLTKPTDADSVLAALADGGKNGATRISTPPLEQVEWDHIHRVISDCGGNISKASKLLGMHRRSLQRKLGKAPRRIS